MRGKCFVWKTVAGATDPSIDGGIFADYPANMNLAELESAVLALPEKDKQALATLLWESMEFSDSEIAGLVQECDEREQQADADPDGWSRQAGLSPI